MKKKGQEFCNKPKEIKPDERLSEGLTEFEKELGWLGEESMLGGRIDFDFGFIKKHGRTASFIKEVERKKKLKGFHSCPLSVMVCVEHLEQFQDFCENYREALENGYRRERMKSVLPRPEFGGGFQILNSRHRVQEASAKLNGIEFEIANLVERGIHSGELSEGDILSIWNFIRKHQSKSLKGWLQKKYPKGWYEQLKESHFTKLLRKTTAIEDFNSERMKLKSKFNTPGILLPPLPGFKRTFEKNDKVKACWLKNQNWYDAKILGYKVEKSTRCGECRKYRVKYLDDNSEADLDEEWVWSEMEYSISLDEKKKKEIKDKGIHLYFFGDDPYAKLKGFYKVDFTGHKIYGCVEDALRAYDKGFVERTALSDVKKQNLFFPEEWTFTASEIFKNSERKTCDSDAVSSTSNSSSEDFKISSTKKPKRIANRTFLPIAKKKHLEVKSSVTPSIESEGDSIVTTLSTNSNNDYEKKLDLVQNFLEDQIKCIKKDKQERIRIMKRMDQIENEHLKKLQLRLRDIKRCRKL